MDKKLVDDLKAARKLIEKPENWVKDHFNGPNDTHCAVGAIDAIPYPQRSATDARMFLRAQLPEKCGGSIIAFNDDPTTTHNDILALFDRAIAAAEAAP